MLVFPLNRLDSHNQLAVVRMMTIATLSPPHVIAYHKYSGLAIETTFRMYDNESPERARGSYRLLPSSKLALQGECAAVVPRGSWLKILVGGPIPRYSAPSSIDLANSDPY